MGALVLVAASAFGTGSLFGAFWATRDRERSLMRMQRPLTDRDLERILRQGASR